MRKSIICLFLFISFLSSAEFKIAAGAGYKAPVMEVVKLAKSSGIKVEASFANMQQVCAQARMNEFLMIIGDKSFLLNKSKLEFTGMYELGKGVLVMISNSNIKDISDLKKARKIAIPQPQKAIYGIAAQEFLQNSNLDLLLKEKIVEVATVPQVGAYVSSGDVDVGFVNLTQIRQKEGHFNHVVIIDESKYSPIIIAAAKLKGCEESEDCSKFMQLLKTKEAKEIFVRYGLE